MNRKYLDRDFYELFILDTIWQRGEDSVILVPGMDQAASAGEIIDAGRILRIELNFEVEKTSEIASHFASLANSLREIGQWYLKSDSEFGVKPEHSALSEPGAIDVWAKYISGYKDFDCSWEGIMDYCKLHEIKGKACDLLSFMCYRYCKYESMGAPEPVLFNAARELSCAFIINGYARKTEKIDMLMDEHDTRSYFSERYDLTINDFRKMANFLEDIDNVKSCKSAIFYNKTRSERAIEKLYRELIEMDVD